MQAHSRAKMKNIVFVILEIFSTTHTVLKIGLCPSDFPQFQLGNIQSCDVFRPIKCKHKYLTDYKLRYFCPCACYQTVGFVLEWTAVDEDQADMHVWEDNWDDDTVEDDFSNQLR